MALYAYEVKCAVVVCYEYLERSELRKVKISSSFHSTFSLFSCYLDRQSTQRLCFGVKCSINKLKPFPPPSQTHRINPSAALITFDCEAAKLYRFIRYLVTEFKSKRGKLESLVRSLKARRKTLVIKRRHKSLPSARFVSIKSVSPPFFRPLARKFINQKNGQKRDQQKL